MFKTLRYFIPTLTNFGPLCQETMTIQRHPRSQRHHDVPISHSPPPYQRGMFRSPGGIATPPHGPSKGGRHSNHEYRRVVGNSEFFYPGFGVPCSEENHPMDEDKRAGDIMYADPKDAVSRRNFFTNNTLTISKVRTGPCFMGCLGGPWPFHLNTIF